MNNSHFIFYVDKTAVLFNTKDITVCGYFNCTYIDIQLENDAFWNAAYDSID